MNTTEAFEIIAKHIFVAYRKYETEFSPIIVLANNKLEAIEKATEHFNIGSSFLIVKAIEGTEHSQVFEI